MTPENLSKENFDALARNTVEMLKAISTVEVDRDELTVKTARMLAQIEAVGLNKEAPEGLLDAATDSALRERLEDDKRNAAIASADAGTSTLSSASDMPDIFAALGSGG